MKCIAVVAALIIIASAPVFASSAIMAYRSNTGTNTLSSPKIRLWDHAGEGAWGSEVELPSAGSPVREAVIKYSPVSNKIVLVTLSDDGNLDAYVCTSNCANAGSWTVTNNIGQVWLTAPATHSRRFDLDFESSTGNAIVVYGVLNALGSCDLAYKILAAENSSFSGVAEQCIDDTSQALDVQYSWIELDRNPSISSKEIVLAGFESTNSRINGWIWNGTAWTSQINIAASASATGGGEALAVKYASDSSKAMMLGGDGTSGNVNYTYWNGTAWSTVSGFDIDTGDALDVKWISLKSDQSHAMGAVFIDSGSDLHTGYWNGTDWNITSNVDTVVDTNTARSADFEWDSSGTGWVVWDTDGNAGSTLSYRICSPICNSTTLTASTYAGGGAWLSMYRNPTQGNNVRILGGRLNSNNDIGSFTWNSTKNITNYGDAAITADTTVTTFEAFTISFQLSPQLKAYGAISAVEMLTGESINFTGNCESVNDTAQGVSISLQNSTDNASFTTISTENTQPLYANISSYSIGTLLGNSSSFIFQLNATTARSNYTLRVQCSALNSEPKSANTTGSNLTVNQALGFLNVTLTQPLSNLNNNVAQNRTFVLNATVTCASNTNNPTAVCSYVNGTARYNTTSTVDTQINTTTGGRPFWTDGNKTCGFMKFSDSCSLNWSVNVTGPIGSMQKVDVLFTSNSSEILQNDTLDANITITDCAIDFTVLWQSISFGELIPDTTANPAPGNAGGYNISVNLGSCGTDFYISGTNLTNTTLGSQISVGNITWSNTTDDYSESHEMSETKVPLKFGVFPVTNVTTWYWINVPPVFAGYYRGIITITGVISGQTP